MDAAARKKIVALGYEDFKTVIEKNLYYVDKTLMIKEILDTAGQTILLTRPRRFGKTLNQSMIRRFFEDERTEGGERIDNGYLFDGLAIADCGEEYLAHRQQYPVISLSLKSAKQPNFEMAREALIMEIKGEFGRHHYALNETLPEQIREGFQRILNGTAKEIEYATALKLLSQCLAEYHQKKVIILIDEYDVPLENAYFAGFYDEMTAFICSFFESALKTNAYLERGVVTGCLRISRESIFTGLNNLEIHTLLGNFYSSSFGFTQSEVKAILQYYSLEDKYPEVRKWYDGYLFGKTEIYNPWSILNYVKFAAADPDTFPQAYWSNTSSNSIVRELVEEADDETRKDLELLMDGGTIEKPIHEEITYGDIHASKDNLWNFLFFTGYLKACSKRQDGRRIMMELAVPNEEVALIYEETIKAWFDEKMEHTDRGPLIRALEEGNCREAENFISAQLMDTISYFDYAELYYHGFLTGLLKGSAAYQVLSNRESGTGRPDIVLRENKFMGKAIIIEMKVTDRFAEMEGKCEEALKQIEEKNYAQSLIDDGYQKITAYGICFFKKGCRVKKA